MLEKRQATEDRHLQILFSLGAAGGMTDGELLARFIDREGEPAELAFAVLVERHGPMVFRVCRSVLRDEHDAQDAFQATFLVLARRAASVQKRDSVASWLHGVSLRVASSARASAIRRRVHERQAAAPWSTISSETEVLDNTYILHEELVRLPERYGTVLVLCYLEGLSCDEAARRLSLPIGTVKSRLARGREHLRVRLIRRGLAPSIGAGLVITAEAAPAVSLEAAVLTAMQFSLKARSAGVVPPTVLALATGVLRTMVMFKIKLAAVSVVIVGLVVPVLVMLSRGAPGAPPRTAEGQAAQRSTKDAVPNFGPGSSVQVKVTNPVTSIPAPIYAVGDMACAKVWVLDTKSKTWHTYRAPTGIKIQPFVPDSPTHTPMVGGDGSFVALAAQGEKIAELAAFCPGTKAWIRQALHEPVNGKIHPMLSDDQFVLYPLGRYVYAFSALTGTWDSVDLGEVRGPRVEKLSVPGIVILKGTGSLYAYDARTGRFSDVESEKK